MIKLIPPHGCHNNNRYDIISLQLSIAMAKQTMVSGTQLDPVQKVIINNNRLYFELHVTKNLQTIKSDT